MELRDIKRIISEEGGKVIITDGEGLSLVVMSYDDYKRLKEGSSTARIEEDRIVEHMPIREERDSKPRSLGIDDLPF